MIAQNIIAWNCRGAKSSEFLREMKELIRVHRPLIIVLVEPKISGVEADTVCKRLGKTRWSWLKASGFSGGVWIVWDEKEVQVKLVYAHKYFHRVEVQTGGGAS